LSEDLVQKAIVDFIVIPIIILLGLYITAGFIDAMLQLNNETFKILFTLVGGIPTFAYYFKHKIREYMK